MFPLLQTQQRIFYNNIQPLAAMFSEDKVTEIYCLADEFCKFFDAQQEKSMLKAPVDGKRHRRKPNRMSNTGYAISLIDNMDSFILDAPVALKIKLLGSMFPEKIEFDGKKYRTKNHNKVLDFIYQQTNELQNFETKNGESFLGFLRFSSETRD